MAGEKKYKTSKLVATGMKSDADNKSRDQNLDIRSNSSSMVYYLPSYDAFASGTLVGANGLCVGQQPYFSSSGYLQPSVSYGSEAVPCYPWVVNHASNGNNSVSETGKSVSLSPSSVKPNGVNSVTTNGNVAQKVSKSVPFTQPPKSQTKVSHLGSEFSAGMMKGFHPSGRLPCNNQKQQGHFEYGTLNYIPSEKIWNGNDRYNLRGKSSSHGEFESSTELTCGPRANRKNTPSDSSVEKEELGFAVRRSKYNIPDFECEYEDAKFYVIKSYSEDDVHKSIKYDVWSSTRQGNKKLESSFHDAKTRASETGTPCPIFLFFSVNSSGQFLGCAEMTGKVDFIKDMDFWQLNKWNGFFPIKWHIIKDIPNSLLKHIILENNDNKPVTYTRDTQEIGLKQGLEMLKIFKSYSAKTSLLDDCTFYENREKSLYANGRNKPETPSVEVYNTVNIPKHIMSVERKIEQEPVRNRRTYNPTSLINVTKNLSLNAVPVKSNASKSPTGNSVSTM